MDNRGQMLGTKKSEMRRLFKLGADQHGMGGPAIFAWQPAGNFLATAGRSGVVHVWNRHGEHFDDIPLMGPGPVLCLEWDCNGEVLAVLQEGNGMVPIWSLSAKSEKVKVIETSLKDPSFLKWSVSGPQLVVGTAKGNILIYNKDTTKKVPVMGKHPKKITCGCWSKDGARLALGSEDATLTLSSATGDTLEQTELKHAPRDMCFAIQKTNEAMRITPDTPETHLSINMGGFSLLLYDLADGDNPLELAVQVRAPCFLARAVFPAPAPRPRGIRRVSRSGCIGPLRDRARAARPRRARRAFGPSTAASCATAGSGTGT